MFADFFSRVPYDKLIKEHGFYSQEGLKPEIYINSENLKNITSREIKKTKALVKNFSATTVHAPFLDISPGAIDKEIRELSYDKIKKILDIATEWQSKLIVMHFNYDPIYYRAYLEKWLANTSDFFCRLLKNDGIPFIALENIAESTPYIVLMLMKKVDHGKLIHCFDLGHHHVFASISFEEWLFYLNPRHHIHFHFHDNFGDNDDHLPLGDGNIDWGKVKKMLSQLEIDFSIGLEPHSRKDLLKTVIFYKNFFLT